MEYKYIKYKEKYFDSLVKLITSSFNIQNKDKSGLIYWKLFHPFLNDETVSYIALASNKVVGHYSNVPLGINYNGKRLAGMVCIDMTTDANHRRRGIISELAKRVYAEVKAKGFDLSIGFSNRDGVQVDKNSSGYGYIIVGPLAQYTTIQLFHKKTSYSLMGTEQLEELKTDSQFIHTEKGVDYLKWRYGQKPGYTYDILSVKGSKIRSYVVTKKIGRRLYLYDLISEKYSDEHVSEILKALINYAVEGKTHVLVVHILNNKFWKSVLKKNNFFKLPYTKHQFYLTVKVHNKDKVLEDIYNPDNWMVLNGDIW